MQGNFKENFVVNQMSLRAFSMHPFIYLPYLNIYKTFTDDQHANGLNVKKLANFSHSQALKTVIMVCSSFLFSFDIFFVILQEHFLCE